MGQRVGLSFRKKARKRNRTGIVLAHCSRNINIGNLQLKSMTCIICSLFANQATTAPTETLSLYTYLAEKLGPHLLDRRRDGRRKEQGLTSRFVRKVRHDLVEGWLEAHVEHLRVCSEDSIRGSVSTQLLLIRCDANLQRFVVLQLV